MGGKNGFIETNIAKRLIDEMAEYLPVTLVPFFRGESLLHPDWYEILCYAQKKGIGPIQFTTNATYLDETSAEKIIELVDFISFSVDTTNAELYNKTRRGSDYHTVVNNIIHFLKIREKNGNDLPEVQVSAVETEEHRPGISDFIDFWKDKVDRVRIYTEHSKDGHPGSIAEKLPSFNNRLPCHKVYTDLIIYWDGEIALCNHDWTRDKTKESIGSIMQNSISRIWRSKYYNNFRYIHETGSVESIFPCNHCEHWKMYYLPESYLGKTYTKRGRVRAQR